jgi:hypothetical protein
MKPEKSNRKARQENTATEPEHPERSEAQQDAPQETMDPLSAEEHEILDALDEVEQTIEAMSSVLGSLRERLADHLQGRVTGPTAVLEDWHEDPEPQLH